MKKQNRQIIIFINVVSQLALSITKFKRKLIAMFFFSEDFAIIDIQRVLNKRVIKSTKRAQIIRIETVKVKRAKIHEASIEFLISLNFETTHFDLKSALFVNKHVSSQSDRIDSFINVFSFANFDISNQSSSELHVVAKLEITYDFVDVFLSAFVSILEIELNAAH
jgi:hypothetical protein